MAEQANKSKHKRSLSLSKRKGPAKSGKSGSSGTTPITSFFNNATPTEVACPLCGQKVPKYRINQHIDLQCKNFERPNSNAVSGSDSDAKSMPLSPTRATTMSSGHGPPSAEKEETNTSPYFKKHNALQEPREIMNKTVVRRINLGSLSSKLSKCHTPPERTKVHVEDGVPYPQKEVVSEASGSSQKENHPQVLGEEACSEVIDLTSAIDAETPKEKPEVLKFERLNKLEAKVSKSETRHHTLGPLTTSSSKHTKRKKGETSKSKMSVSSKKVKYEDSSSTSGEALSGEDLAQPSDNSQCRAQEPSTKCSTLLNGSSNETHKDQTAMMDEQEEMTRMMEGQVEMTTEMESDWDGATVTEVHDSSVTNSSDVPTESGVEKTAKDNEGSPPQRIAYYLRNFRTVLEAVLENEDDKALFNEDDLKLIDAFENLSVMGQKLYVRLFQRKLKWLQVNKLDYEEISSDLGPVAQELVDGGFLQSESDLQDLGEVLDLLPAPELKSLAKTFHLGGSGTQKQQLVDGLLRLSKQKSLFTMAKGQNSIEAVILKRAKQLAGHSVRLCRGPRAVFSRVLLLFSMTDTMEEDETAAAGGQSQLYTILLVHSGRLSFPDYTVERRAKLFQDREDLIRYEAATRALQEVITAMQAGHWDEALELYTTARTSWQELRKIYDLSHQEQLPVFLRCFTTGWAYTRILSRGVEILQRLRRYEEAVEELHSLLAQSVYCPDSRGRWWDRLALNLQQHLKQPEQAIKAIRDGLSDPLVRTGHQLSLHQRAVRMKESPSFKKYRLQLRDLPTMEVQDVPHVTIRGQLFPHQGGMGKSVFLMPADEEEGQSANTTIMCSVEDLSLAHYRRQGFDQGIHGEGSTFSTLFGLLLWDIIFMEGIPDAFRNPYQTCPLDHFTDCFYENRREAIETRVQVLKEASVETLCDMLEDVWSSQEGKVCSLVNWERFSSLQQAQSLVSCLGGVFLGGIIARMAKDYRHCRGGLPDLVVWNTTNHSYKLVEVKGPNDRLSQKQQIWLDELQKLGADVEVCHVTAIGARGAPLDA